ncbi:M48 family metalloprotease [Undibacterium oligocarboniphilum]|uniref:M48 family metallopeptidase n=1 Tax=Undibacterium oligocarboniphilum TaxID=666702 RepID=A0A850QH42_9BURK|nr:M48 family metalloprotease [Undibacterium oligocarboniphilum]MBC3870749.1 M48 family metallopeptidase [Undibacterium oligocarboniphilum]NVO78449.1 M48 family metallopeptidase [Undibacterium oligocarboniphilum]
MSEVFPVSGNDSTAQGRIGLVTKKVLRASLLAATCFVVPEILTVNAAAQNLPTLGDTSREELSPLMERRLGEQIMNAVRRDPDYMDDGPVSEYLNRLGNKMLDARPDARGEAAYDFEFFAVRDPVLNAFAFPGGFIGLHSGLILAAQSESELASVIGHEIGHVAQRHIARMLTSQKFDSLIPLAALALAVLAARTSPDAAIALATGGQGLAIQRQLNFSRDAEREADRVGFQILRDSGFDTSGMVSFFGRLQASMRNYTDNAPAYLRSHPLTSERIADIQARMLDQRYKQHADSLEFFLTKARVRILQDATIQGLMDAKVFFEGQLKSEKDEDKIAAEYGLSLVALKQFDFAAAHRWLDAAKSKTEKLTSQKSVLTTSSAYVSVAIDILMAEKRDGEAVAEAEKAMQLLPLSRGLVYQYVEALLSAKKTEAAGVFLRDQISLYRQDARLQNLLAKVYDAQGKQALQHIALAEAYAIQNTWTPALQQLDIARREKDAGFYEQSVIDAFEREWKEKHKEELAGERKHKLTM